MHSEMVTVYASDRKFSAIQELPLKKILLQILDLFDLFKLQYTMPYYTVICYSSLFQCFSQSDSVQAPEMAHCHTIEMGPSRLEVAYLLQISRRLLIVSAEVRMFSLIENPNLVVHSSTQAAWHPLRCPNGQILTDRFCQMPSETFNFTFKFTFRFTFRFTF